MTIKRLEGIILVNATVKALDGSIHNLPIKGTDSEGYSEVLIDAIGVGGIGYMQRQSIKPYIGMKVEFIAFKGYSGFNFKIIK